MWRNLPDRQRLALGGLGLFAVVVVGWVGSSCLHRPRDVAFLQGGGAPGRVKVHVVGAVKKPGLVELSADARVQDAIDKAGGATEDANPNALNLAAHLVDGSQIVVPRAGEAAVAPSASGAGPQTPDSSSAAQGSISLNSAGLAELDKLPGVGPATAQKIVDYRNSHGGFRTIDELMAVPGIGPKKMEKMRAYLRL